MATTMIDDPDVDHANTQDRREHRYILPVATLRAAQVTVS